MVYADIRGVRRGGASDDIGVVDDGSLQRFRWLFVSDRKQTCV